MADLTCERIRTWTDQATSNEVRKDHLLELIGKYSDGSYPVLVKEVKEAYISFVCSLEVDSELFELSLQLLRIILRDKASPDLECFLTVLKQLVRSALLDVGQNSLQGQTEDPVLNIQVVLEADKCLVNLLFNSAKARVAFQDVLFNKLLARISILASVISGEEISFGEFNYLKDWNASSQEELFLYDLKIAFIMTAQVRKLQNECIIDVEKTQLFRKIVNLSIDKIQGIKGITAGALPFTMPWKWVNESLKILFNFYHSAKMFDLDVAFVCAKDCSRILQDSVLDPETKQNAVNLLAVMPSTLHQLCPEINLKDPKRGKEIPVQEGYDMSFVDALLRTFEEQIDKHEKEKEITIAEHLAMFLTALNHLCTIHKAARRYCRLKVIPPLRQQDVERRPDVGADFRNKIVRLMMNSNRTGELAAEFLFVLCKRSVGRLIKYCGFGHSAGLLANYGFLGQALGARHPSDSEDSETEEYKRVEEKINPVTGHIPPPGHLEEFQRQLESMSEEQKEYEVMKLVNSLDKLMDQGVIVPGTIGEDGRPRQMNHVAELIKDVKEENLREEDSD